MLQQEGARGPQQEEEEVLLPWAEDGLKDITAESTRAAELPKGHLLQGWRAVAMGTCLLLGQARAAPSCIPLGRAPTWEHGTARPGYEHAGNTLLLPKQIPPSLG